MIYTDPLQAKGILPTTATYQQINFNDTIYLVWQNSTTIQDNQYIITSNIDLAPSVDNLKIYLPSVANQSVGVNFVLNNITNNKIYVYDLNDDLCFEINPIDINSPNAMYVYVAIGGYRWRVQGSTSNVVDITQSIGNGLQVAINEDNESILTVKSNTAPIEDILFRVPGTQTPTFAIRANATALDSIDYTLIVTDVLDGQIAVLLDYAYDLAISYGYQVKVINASQFTVVFQTEVGDTINGQANQYANAGAYASFVLQPDEACTLLATEQSGWRINVANSLINKTFNTTNIDVNTAQINALNSNYYIDFSKSPDVAFSSILVITGTWDNTRYPINQTQGLYLVMPNNISTMYFITSNLTGYTNFKIGLGVKTSDGVQLITGSGKQMGATPKGAVGFTYICYESNGQQNTTISPLALDLGTTDSVPIGTIAIWATSSPPGNYLICDGRPLFRVQYPDLFAIIGTIYGGGNTSDLFNIPDLRGVFVRGLDNGRGIDPGTGVIPFTPPRSLSQELQQSNNLAHSHDVTDLGHVHGGSWQDTVGHTHSITDPGHGHSNYVKSSGGGQPPHNRLENGAAANQTDWVTGNNTVEDSFTGISVNSTTLAGGAISASNNTTGIVMNSSGTSESRPINIALNYIIKVQ